MTDLVWVVSSSTLILAVLLLRAVFGKKMSAGMRYALWGLVLIRLLIPGTVFSSPVSVKSAVARTEVAENIEAVKEYSSIVVTGENGAVGYRRGNAGEATELKNVTPEKAETYRKTIKARDVLNVIWITGAALMAAYFLYVNLRFYLKIRDRRILIRVNAPCRVYSVEGLESSCLFFNTIYVSKEAAEDPEQLRCVLAHELSHRAHGDGFINLLKLAALALHWHNPLVWLSAFCARQDSELFADAGAVKRLGEEERLSYGKTLIALSARPSVRASIACTATTMANNKRALKERVTNVAKARRTGTLIAIVVLVFAFAAAGCVFLGSAKTNENTETDPTQQAVTDTPEAAATSGPTKEPTSGPTEETNAPTNEWLLDEARKVASRVLDVHGVMFDLSEGRIIRANEQWGEMAVSFSNEEKHVHINVYFFKNEEGEWYTCIKNCLLGFENIDEPDPDKFEADMAAIGWPNGTVTAGELESSGFILAGEDDFNTVAAYAAQLAARAFVECSEDNYFRCWESAVVEIGVNTFDPNTHTVRIALRPVNDRYFMLGYEDIFWDLCEVPGKEEYNGWFSIFMNIVVSKNADGSYDYSVNFMDN